MKYLIIQLSDESVSFCNYLASENASLISLDKLEKGLIWGIKHGLNIQILYPNFDLPQSYLSLIDKFEHINICSPMQNVEPGILVVDDINYLSIIHNCEIPVILHVPISFFINKYKEIASHLSKFVRLNICFTDIHFFTDTLSKDYERALDYIADKIFEFYQVGKPIQFNLITDRTLLSEMNNCNAGVETITLAPDGKFYICPAFYLSSSSAVGSPEEDIKIPNNHLYRISFAPICRECDAFHCKRCIYQNQLFTNEVNTPGHNQCVMSHIERNVSRKLLKRIREFGEYAPNISIPQIDHTDPFDNIINNR